MAVDLALVNIAHRLGITIVQDVFKYMALLASGSIFSALVNASGKYQHNNLKWLLLKKTFTFALELKNRPSQGISTSNKPHISLFCIKWQKLLQMALLFFTI